MSGLVLPRLHLITDDRVLRAPDFLEAARAIIAEYGGEVALHLRGHGLSGGELFRLAATLAPIAAKAGAALLINDRIDLALAVPGAGVQLGRRSLMVSSARQLLGANRWIGYSAHNVTEVQRATAAGADHILLGTIYASATHPGEAPAGVEVLRGAARVATRPLIAIGGVTPARVAEVRAAGAYGVAVLGGIWHADRPLAAVGAYYREIERDRGVVMTTIIDKIEVIVNGESRQVAAGRNIVELLTDLGLDHRLIVVEHNREILDRESYGVTEVQGGDTLELVHFVGGG